ncbi:hypothetical protein [Cytobacillus sp.]|uniref:hypothetical protein n=1 Tax=Cytobacillus sp. TaxID=2675269 RepID=UPI0028BF47E0|nr:hypothetical protein [Cytobacillus sp.]
MANPITAPRSPQTMGPKYNIYPTLAPITALPVALAMPISKAFEWIFCVLPGI